MKPKSGTVGWACLAGFVVAWDWWAGRTKQVETLSSAFGRAVRHPVRRWPVTMAWTVTTAHLFGVIPARIDPFVLVGAIIVNEKVVAAQSSDN